MCILYLKLADYFLTVATDSVDTDVQLSGYFTAFHSFVYHRKNLTLPYGLGLSGNLYVYKTTPPQDIYLQRD